MSLRNVIIAGALAALVAPVAALAAPSTTTTHVSAQSKAQAAQNALNALSPSHRAQVKNILALVSSKQMGKTSGAVQIDAVLSQNEAKQVLAQAAKIHDNATDAGFFLVSAQ